MASTHRSVVFALLGLLFLAVPRIAAAVDFRISNIRNNQGEWSAIATDPRGVAHVVLEGGYFGYTDYMVLNRNYGATERIGHHFLVQEFDMALDSAGDPHVVYEYTGATGTYGVVHVTRSGGSWTWGPVLTTAPARFIDIDVDVGADGGVHAVFYQDTFSPRLSYWSRPPGGDWAQAWQVDSGFHSALAIGGSTLPRLVFKGVNPADPTYAFLENDVGGEVWHTQTINGDDTFRYPSMVMYGTYVPHISYSRPRLRYATKVGASWVTTDVDPSVAESAGSSIDLDSQGDPHISYYDATTGDVKYAHKSGSSWIVQIVDTSSETGPRLHTSLSLDVFNQPHISYYHPETGYFRYARAQDCNQNGVHDIDDIASGAAEDCNYNGVLDECEIIAGLVPDCNGNGVPDDCDEDCNGNGIPDECDITSGYSLDCNRNDIPDECDLASGTSQDCNGNGILDECDIKYGGFPDCDKNGVPDECDFASGEPVDCNFNNEIDLCELPDVIHLGSSESGWFGQAVASGDFNADGFSDIAVGQPGWSGNKGRVLVFYGGDPMDTVADLVKESTSVGSNYGYSLAVGNINGDAYDDLIIGSPGYNNGDGVAFLFRGTAGISLPYWTVKGAPYPDQRFGTSVALADINGDGLEDMIVGAPERTTNAEPGFVYVYSGSSPGGNPIATWVAAGNNDGFGYSVANAGDVDANGLDDVIVGAFGGSTTGEVGYANLYLSHLGGSTPGPVLSTGAVGDLFGHAVAGAGDLNDDGIDDFIVGAPRSGVLSDMPGRAFLYFGSETPDGIADLTFVGAEHLADLGSAVAGVGDINDDGFDDLVIGSDHYYNGTEFSWADIFFGGPHLDAVPDKRFMAESRGYGMGMTVGPAGDTDGDGIREVLIANPLYSNNKSFNGRVSIVSVPLPGFGDCNGNGIPDVCDIASGFSMDFNQNGIPDECGETSAVDGPDVPLHTRLLGAFPTPFNPRTELRFELAATEAVDLRVYDLSGKLIRTLARSETFDPGRHALSWQGRDDAGRQVASGIYFYRLEAGTFGETKRMILLK